MATCQILSSTPKFTGFRKEYVNQNATSDSNNTGSFVIGVYSDSTGQVMYATKVPVVYEFVCEGSWFTITQNLEVPTGSNTTKHTDLLPYTKKSSGSGNYFTTAKIRTSLTPTGPSQKQYLTLDYEIKLAGQSGYLQLRSVTIGGTPLMGIADFIYPVGSIYMSVNSTSPATLFGGTWEAIEGRFLLGAVTSTTLATGYQPGDVGGEAAHTLTIQEMPKHSHVERYSWTDGGSTLNTLSCNGVALSATNVNGFAGIDRGDTNTTETGSSFAHNNMPPYLAVYMWKRTA